MTFCIWIGFHMPKEVNMLHCPHNLLCDFLQKLLSTTYELFYLCLWFFTSINTIMNQNMSNGFCFITARIQKNRCSFCSLHCSLCFFV